MSVDGKQFVIVAVPSAPKRAIVGWGSHIFDLPAITAEQLAVQECAAMIEIVF